MLFIFLLAAAGTRWVAVASDASSKKQESAETSKTQTAPPPSKPAPVEQQAKREEPLKWDQLDPKSLEQRAKTQTPFARVPAER